MRKSSVHLHKLTLPTKVEIAYAAGLFEGEGTVGNRIKKGGDVWNSKQSKYYYYKPTAQIRFKIAMTDLEPIEQFDDIFEVGRLLGPYKVYGNGKQYKDRWHYEINTFEHIQYIMAMMWGWLSPRRKEQYSKASREYLSFHGKVSS